MIFIITFIFSIFLLFTQVVFAADMMIGGVTNYTVQKGDRLQLIGAKLGVFWMNIAKENNLDPKAPCVPGQVLKITTRKIVPRIIEDGIIVNIADRTLYYFKEGKLTAYPIGVGLAREDDFGDWRTPIGKFVIVGKRKNPTWSVPDSIMLEMAYKGKEIEETVPPGPKNPLGRYAIRTSIPGVLIHETIWPSSVYRFQSHGCIRMLPDDIEKFFDEVKKGTKGEIIYEPVKILMTQNGKPYLEVRTDTYKRLPSLKEQVWKMIDERGIRDKVDVGKVEQLIKEQSGIAEDIAFYPKKEQSPYMVKTFYQRVIDFFKPRLKGEKKSSEFQSGSGLNRSVQNCSSSLNLKIVSGFSDLTSLT